MIPAMRPRYYSVSCSSSVVSPRQAAITAVVSDKALAGTSEGNPGLATNCLLALNGSLQQALRAHPRAMSYALDGPQNLLSNNKIHAHIRKSTFKLPAISPCPVIMVAAGTGIAPFRAFLQERATLLKMGREVGRRILFFGCGNQEHDFIYKKKLREVAQTLGDCLSIVAAFSRPDHGTRAYVQDKVEEHADEVCDLLVNDDTHFYICGSASMVRQMSNVIGAELRTRQSWDEETLKGFANRQKRSKWWMHCRFLHATTYIHTKETLTKEARCSILSIVWLVVQWWTGLPAYTVDHRPG